MPVPQKTSFGAVSVEQLEPRIEHVLRIESTLLAARYAGYLLVVCIYAVGFRPAFLPDLIVITIGAFLQNVFVHWILYTRRYALFQSPLNFIVHLCSVSMIVGLTGAEGSPLCMLYLMVIIGYCLYSRTYRGIYNVMFACSTAYSITMLAKWLVNGLDPDYSLFALNLIAIYTCGWFMNSLFELLHRTEMSTELRTQALTSSEGLLRGVFDNVADPVLVYNENEQVTDVNTAACEYLATTRQGMLGRRLSDFIFDDGTQPHRFVDFTGQTRRTDAIMVIEGGEERGVRLFTRPFVLGNRHIFIATVRDITDQQRAEIDYRQSVERLEQAQRDLVQVYTLRNSFFLSTSKKVHSPLSAIIGYIDLLLNDELGEMTGDQRKSLQACRRSAIRVLDLLHEAFEVDSLSHGVASQ